MILVNSHRKCEKTASHVPTLHQVGWCEVKRPWFARDYATHYKSQHYPRLFKLRQNNYSISRYCQHWYELRVWSLLLTSDCPGRDAGADWPVGGGQTWRTGSAKGATAETFGTSWAKERTLRPWRRAQLGKRSSTDSPLVCPDQLIIFKLPVWSKTNIWLLLRYSTTTLRFVVNTDFYFHLLCDWVVLPCPMLGVWPFNTRAARLHTTERLTLLIISYSQLLLLIDSGLEYIDLEVKPHSF